VARTFLLTVGAAIAAGCAQTPSPALGTADCAVLRSVVEHAPSGFVDILGETVTRDMFTPTIWISAAREADQVEKKRGGCVVTTINPSAPSYSCWVFSDDEIEGRTLYERAVAGTRSCLSGYVAGTPRVLESDSVIAQTLFGNPSAKRELLDVRFVAFREVVVPYYSVEWRVRGGDSTRAPAPVEN